MGADPRTLIDYSRRYFVAFNARRPVKIRGVPKFEWQTSMGAVDDCNSAPDAERAARTMAEANWPASEGWDVEVVALRADVVMDPDDPTVFYLE